MSGGSPFVVFALPRSRSFWLSRYLSCAGYHCWHEQAPHFRSLGDVQAWLSQDFTGASETTAAPFWRTIVAARPDVRVLVVRRPVGEVVDSLMRLDMRGFARSITPRSNVRCCNWIESWIKLKPEWGPLCRFSSLI